jgi:exodeoxyribonuclease VII large subunit
MKRLNDAARARVDGAALRLAAMESHLKHLNPQLVLERGYSIAADASGAVVRSGAQVAPGDVLDIIFARGSARTEVKTTNK